MSVTFLSIGGNSKLFIVPVLEISKNEEQKYETFEEKKINIIEMRLSQTFSKIKIWRSLSIVLTTSCEEMINLLQKHFRNWTSNIESVNVAPGHFQHYCAGNLPGLWRIVILHHLRQILEMPPADFEEEKIGNQLVCYSSDKVESWIKE